MLTLVCGTKQQGFSLLELMIVLVLAGLLSSIAVTSMSKGPVLRKAAYDLRNSLRHTRNIALIQQREMVWKINLTSKNYGIDTSSNSHMTARQQQLAPDFNVQVDSASSENSHKTLAGIRFFPNGSSTGGSIKLMHKKQGYNINVEWLSGRISIQ